MDLSIVTTMYCSEPHLEEFYQRVSAVAQQVVQDYEILFVNDGSPDQSLDIAIALYEHDPRVRIVDLSRNFGHHKAIMTGLSFTRGKRVFLIDCDLEEEPELLLAFWAEMTSTGSDMVYGVQDTRKGGWFERASGNLFYTLFNWLSNYPVPRNVVTARLMTQRYVISLVEHKDREIFLLGLWTITGYKQMPLMIHKHSKGNSTYDLRRKMAVFVNSVTSFSSKPLIFVFYLGLAISFLAAAAVAYLVIQRIFFGVFLTGWPSLIVSVWLLGGLTIFCLGIIGIYLSKIFGETKQRPYTVVRERYEHETGDTP
jgi:putative glycosyltransferase